jgi:hypothetical protein
MAKMYRLLPGQSVISIRIWLVFQVGEIPNSPGEGGLQ